MTQKNRVTDYSKREFPCISGFIYALAALDTRYMTSMMLMCIRKDETLTIGEKKGLAHELQKQYHDFESNGVTYILDGVTYEKQKNFGIQELIQALKDYVDNFNQWSGDERNNHLCTKIGGAQRLVPAHVAQHYCEPGVPFGPKPGFMAEKFNRCSMFCYYANGSNYNWWAHGVNAVLGRDFGVIRANQKLPWGCTYGHHIRLQGYMNRGIPLDSEAVKSLSEIRTKDKEAIPQLLESLLQELNQIEEPTAQPRNGGLFPAGR